MKVIHANNVNGAFRRAVECIFEDNNWREISPRGNATREYFTPVATVYEQPWRRVLFCSVRDANPFFHMMEALWMLAGRSDRQWVEQFSKNIGQFAEDNGFFHGAYGDRWRNHFELDQLDHIVKSLRKDPDTRRAVLAMWDPQTDLATNKRDIPCNTHVYFKVRENVLHMTVHCRSNDIIWGCYGANAVHFSILMEYVAHGVGARVGTYTHTSDSWHYYVDNPTYQKLLSGAQPDDMDYHYTGRPLERVAVLAMFNTPLEVWNEDLQLFMTDQWDDPIPYQDSFFSRTAYPMRDAYHNYKRGDMVQAIHMAKNIESPDWSLACRMWLERRKK